MARTVLRHFTTVAVTVVLIAATLFGVGIWRRSQDASWCRSATAGFSASGTARPLPPDLPGQQRSACAVQRRRQRVFFGAVWRSGGQAMAACGFDWARLQLLSEYDPAAAASILKAYGITDPNFDTSSGSNETDFLHVCLAKDHGG